MVNEDQSGELNLSVESIEFVYDQLDTNALNCKLSDGYFNIQTSVYLEEDEQLNEPFIELNDQSSAQCVGIERVVFSDADVVVQFAKGSWFLKSHGIVRLSIRGGVTRGIVGFFVNSLFLGEIVSYSDDFDRSKICPIVATRELL
jgi:hypothetical protein